MTELTVEPGGNEAAFYLKIEDGQLCAAEIGLGTITLPAGYCVGEVAFTLDDGEDYVLRVIGETGQALLKEWRLRSNNLQGVTVTGFTLLEALGEGYFEAVLEVDDVLRQSLKSYLYACGVDDKIAYMLMDGFLQVAEADEIAEICRFLTRPGDRKVEAARVVRANESLTVEDIKERGSLIPAGWVDPLEALT